MYLIYHDFDIKLRAGSGMHYWISALFVVIGNVHVSVLNSSMMISENEGDLPQPSTTNTLA